MTEQGVSVVDGLLVAVHPTSGELLTREGVLLVGTSDEWGMLPDEVVGELRPVGGGVATTPLFEQPVSEIVMQYLWKTYRKKPVEVQVWRLDEETENPEEIADWCGGEVVNNLGHPSGKIAIVIPTLEGPVTAQFGDYIIRGVAGEFYPCKPDIFNATYDEV